MCVIVLAKCSFAYKYVQMFFIILSNLRHKTSYKEILIKPKKYANNILKFENR